MKETNVTTANTQGPKLIATLFNQCINNQDIGGLADLMSEDHTFIDREGKVHQSKQVMIQGWKQFFQMFPKYKNTFTRLESVDNRVAILGHAYWSDEQPYDPVIWTATVVNDLVAVWRVYSDTEENRKTFNLV